MRLFLIIGLSFVLSLVTALMAQDVAGLRVGSNLTSTSINGDLVLTCFEAGRTQVAYQRCYDNILSGENWSKFYYDAEVNADRVELIATWENGRVVKKSSSFNRLSGESSSAFNLWIWSLLQRPLLSEGNNEIHYKLQKGNTLVQEGDFIVTITPTTPRRCNYGRYTSYRIADCQNAVLLCRRYFQDENYCL